jgi:hypothetical protein
MGFKDKLEKYSRDTYMKKYGDRITSASGTVISIKSVEKNYFFIRTLVVDMIIKPEVGKAVIKARYKKRKWFKKIDFISINKGNKVMIMGLKGVKGKKDADVIILQNVLNLTTKKDLVPIDHSQIKKSRQQAGRMRY